MHECGFPPKQGKQNEEILTDKKNTIAVKTFFNPLMRVSSMSPRADRLNMPLFRESGDEECVRLGDREDEKMVGQEYEGCIDSEGLLVRP